MITRREVSVAGGLGLLLSQRLSRAQTAAQIRRIGYLGSLGYLLEALKQGMRDLGWLEGSNVEYRVVSSGGDLTRYDALAQDLLSQQVEVLVATSAQATRSAQRATKTIPIVMTGISNVVDNGFAESLAKPGGNITGIATQGEEVLSKLVELLHEAVPGAQRVAILLDENHPSHVAFWAFAQATCAKLGLVAQRTVASAPGQFAAAVEQIVRQRSQAIVVMSDAMYLIERMKLQELMSATRLPVAYGNPEHVVAGGLLSYATDFIASFRYAARWVDKILKGATPADLPIEQPTNFKLVVNMKTAKVLGLTIPQSLLLRADEIIQ